MCSLCSFLALRDKSCPLETFPQLERNSLRFRFPNNLVRDYVENAFAAKGRKYRRTFVSQPFNRPFLQRKAKNHDSFFAFSILEWTVSERTHFFSLSLPDRSELHDCESKEQLGQEDHIESFLGKPATDLDSLKPTFSYQKISF